MDLQTFIEKFAQQFDETDASEIWSNTIFQELEEWSSLTTLSIIAFIKTECGKKISGKEIRSCETVQELFKLVETL